MLKILHGVSLSALFLLAVQAPAQAQDADPAKWGLYARIAGVERQSSADGYRLRWRWVKPNVELAEDYILPRTGQVASTNTITLGEQPGTLLVTGSIGVGKKYWDGKVLPDGSVDFIGRGFIKMPYRAVLLADGTYELRGLDLSKGEVTSARSANARDRYSPVDGAISTKEVPVKTAAAPAVVSSPTSPPAPDFGFLDRFVGRSFVSRLYTLDVYREGQALALHFGDAGGQRNGGRLLVMLDGAGGYSLVDTSYASSPKNRLAYFDNSGALNLEYTSDDYRHLTRFIPAGDAIEIELLGAERRFGRFGSFSRINSNVYAPVTDEALRVAAINNQANQQRLQQEAQEERERKRERDAEESARMNATYEGLQQALADATASEARSRAALDATLQQAAQQAADERQRAAQREQQQANERAAEDARHARQVTEQQYETARQFEAQQQAQRVAQQQAQQEAQRAAASRPATQPARPVTAPSGTMGTVPDCPKVYKTGTGSSGFANTQAEAERWARRDMELQCPMANYSAGTMQCSQKKQGDVVSIDSNGHSSKTGEMTAWVCQAEFRCNQPSDQCPKGPARGSAQ